MRPFIPASVLVAVVFLPSWGCANGGRVAYLPATREMVPLHPASQPTSISDEPVLTEADQAVLTTVLLDLITYDEFRPWVRGAEAIVVSRESVSLPSDPPLLRTYTEAKVSRALNEARVQPSSEITSHLIHRNAGSASLAGLARQDESVILANPHSKRGEEQERAQVVQWGDKTLMINVPVSFAERYPTAKGWVHPLLPGYSADGRTAVVLFYCGPSAHGAEGEYVLERTDAGWVIRWRDVRFFV